MKINEIIEYSASKYNVSIDDVLAKRGCHASSSAKHLAIYLIYGNTELSMTEIGKIFQIKHTSVLHSLKKTSIMLNKSYKTLRKPTKMDYEGVLNGLNDYINVTNDEFWQADKLGLVDWKGIDPQIQDKKVRVV